jgi:hypothetical protein
MLEDILNQEIAPSDDTVLESLDVPYQLPAFVDSSMLSTFRACPRKFYLTYCHNLKPRGSSIHLVAGSAIAAGLHAIRQAQGNTDAPLSHDALCEAAIGPFLSAWGDHPNDPEHPKNQHNMFNALELYIEKWHPYYDSVQPLKGADGRATSEFSFAIPLPINHPNGAPFIFVGRFDLLGYYTENNLLVVLDDKTSGSLGSYWMRQWDMRGQFLGYLWALRSLGYDISHVVVRGIGLLKTDTILQHVPLEYPTYLIERWFHELINTIELMKVMYQHQHFPYNFGDACSSYGGCPMKDLCLNKDPDRWLNNYKVEIWNPVGED